MIIKQKLDWPSSWWINLQGTNVADLILWTTPQGYYLTINLAEACMGVKTKIIILIDAAAVKGEKYKNIVR